MQQSCTESLAEDCVPQGPAAEFCGLGLTHALHSVLPVESWYWFRGQSLHCVAPVLLENLPRAHAAHDDSLEPCVEVEYLPEPHCVHTLAPDDDEYVPVGHPVHAPAPDDAEYVPALHGTHALAPDVEYFPAVQLEHALAPAAE